MVNIPDSIHSDTNALIKHDIYLQDPAGANEMKTHVDFAAFRGYSLSQ